MSRFGPLRGGASDIDHADPASVERAESRRAAAEAQRDYQQAMAEYMRPRLSDRHGMRLAPHHHDAAPRPPALPVTDADSELDPTGRRRYQADTSPHVIRTVTCTAPGCDFTGIYLGREDTLDRIRQAGGPRCADHPLDPDALANVPQPPRRALGV